MSSVPVVIYEQIEQAIIERLRLGLGKMVRQVVSYSGEMDDDLGAIVRLLPAVWVTFGGINRSKPIHTDHHKILCTGTFAVMVATQNVRSDVAARHTVRQTEVGSNTLIWAVRRLLAHQDLGLPIKPIAPSRVRSLFNTRLANQAISGYGCEFEVEWIESTLPNSTWPVPQESATDGVYQIYHGKVDKPAPDLFVLNVGITNIDQPENTTINSFIQLGENEDESHRP